MTLPENTVGVAVVHNPAIWEQLPNARLRGTARDVFDVLTARQEPGGHVRIYQGDIAERLNITKGAVSRAMSDLRDLGLIHPRTKQGYVLIHPLFAGYESVAHMVNHLDDPATEVWALRFPVGDMQRPRRAADARTGTGSDPDPDGGEGAPAPEARPNLRLAG
ncbi:MarR family transcriptional regulator [Streptomyces yaizuensis]|uniref:Helix-turn-helix domain-containing protein n=1 Tax=Streptomyces yaizuensis TaxID=2989713 RepID=A0AA86IXV8_9ACTN|nr:helix-turn-helix domain-containing protein [Streptomyces sp. YSPA8]BDT39515.1 helix-turn-helix domain-containing protein [Streptomyces sp. YSPA8]